MGVEKDNKQVTNRWATTESDLVVNKIKKKKKSEGVTGRGEGLL